MPQGVCTTHAWALHPPSLFAPGLIGNREKNRHPMRLKGVEKTQRVPQTIPEAFRFQERKESVLSCSERRFRSVGSHAFIEARDDVALQFKLAHLARGGARKFRDNDEIFRELVFGDAPRIEKGDDVPEREL